MAKDKIMYFDESMSLEDAYSKWIQTHLILDPTHESPSKYFDYYGLLGSKGSGMTILHEDDYKKSLKEVSMTLQNEKVVLLRARFRASS